MGAKCEIRLTRLEEMVKAAVLAGALRPVENVSVANTTWAQKGVDNQSC